MAEFDLVIVGAGVAGAALALGLAQEGYKIALVDREPASAEALSTHFIWPRGISYLARLGVLGCFGDRRPFGRTLRLRLEDIEISGQVPLATTRARLAAVHGNDHAAAEAYACIRRHILDATIADAAVTAGVERFIASVISLDTRADGVRVGLKTKRGRSFSLDAKFVAGADGRGSTVAALIAAETIDRRTVGTACAWSYFDGIPSQPVILAKKGRTGFGAAATNDGQTMVLAWADQTNMGAFQCTTEAEFKAFVASVVPDYAEAQLRPATMREKIRRARGLDAYKRQAHKDRAILLGDAACFKDQCTASGITHALRDAELATTALHAALRGDRDYQSAFADYAHKREADIAAYFNMACDAAAMRPATGDELTLMRTLQAQPALADLYFATLADSSPPAAFSAALAAPPRPSTGDSRYVRAEPGAAFHHL